MPKMCAIPQLVSAPLNPIPTSERFSISFAPSKDLIVFAYQIWKLQVLLVVQSPLDNCHSPFSLTTFFEISVYIGSTPDSWSTRNAAFNMAVG